MFTSIGEPPGSDSVNKHCRKNPNDMQCICFYIYVTTMLYRGPILLHTVCGIPNRYRASIAIETKTCYNLNHLTTKLAWSGTLVKVMLHTQIIK